MPLSPAQHPSPHLSARAPLCRTLHGLAAILCGLALALTVAPTSATGPANQAPARASLLPLAQPLWTDLTPPQQQVLAPFESQWNGLPVEEKRAWVAVAKKFPKLPPAEQKKATQRAREWAALTPEQRRTVRQNYRLAKTLPRDERVAQWNQYQTMTPEQRSVLRTSGTTSNTAAKHAGARTGLAKEAAKPIARATGTPPAGTLPPSGQ